MEPAVTLELRRRELERRSRDLPTEVDEWQARVSDDLDMNIHWSQLESIGALTRSYGDQQRQILNALPAADDRAGYEARLFDLLNAIVASQRAWDFFRSKLELRRSNRFKRRLRVADIVAIDCYDAALKQALANSWLAQDDVREPPLTYLSPEISPMTWVRGARPSDGRTEELEGKTLPIPVIELPFDHLANVWEFLSLHHEVGHEIDADLKLLPEIKGKLTAALQANVNIPDVRKRRWSGWLSEILADLIALQLGGPAFADMLLHMLLLPQTAVTTIVLGDVHPNHYLRIRLASAYIHTMADAADASGDAGFATRLRSHADGIDALWAGLYGAPTDLQAYLADIPLVISAVMDSDLPVLGGNKLRSLIPYTSDQDRDVREAAVPLRTGGLPGFTIAPRHAVSASRLAVNAAMNAGASDSDLNTIADAAVALIEREAPRGLRAADNPLFGSSNAREARAARFVSADLKAPTDLSRVLMKPWN